MGRSIAITYTVEMVTRNEAGQQFRHTPSEWRVRARYGNLPGHGKPTLENLTTYVTAFEVSTRANGCNAHLGVQKVLSARIIDQRVRSVVATYMRPADL